MAALVVLEKARTEYVCPAELFSILLDLLGQIKMFTRCDFRSFARRYLDTYKFH